MTYGAHQVILTIAIPYLLLYSAFYYRVFIEFEFL